MKESILLSLRAIGVMLCGLVGGFLAVLYFGYIKPIYAIEKVDPISIANTYIAFTAFLFVVASLALVSIGFFISHYFGSEKTTHHKDVLADLLSNFDTGKLNTLTNGLSLSELFMKTAFQNAEIRIKFIARVRFEVEKEIERQAGLAHAQSAAANSLKKHRIYRRGGNDDF